MKRIKYLACVNISMSLARRLKHLVRRGFSTWRTERFKFPELKVCKAKIPGGRYGKAVSKRSYNNALKAVVRNPNLAKFFVSRLESLRIAVDGVIVGKTKEGRLKVIPVEKAIEAIWQIVGPVAPYSIKREPKP